MLENKELRENDVKVFNGFFFFNFDLLLKLHVKLLTLYFLVYIIYIFNYVTIMINEYIETSIRVIYFVFILI